MTGRAIAVLMDGTRSDQTDRHPTNILRMHRLISPEATSLYFRGLGNEFDDPGLFSQLMAGAFGAGADDKVDAAYAALSTAWQSEEDLLFLFGFSRGASTARMLAQRVHEEGINGRPAAVELLGCFDTVASFGVPGNDVNLFKDFHVAPNVRHARHAVALHETRDMFPVTLMNRRPGVEEVWFRGDHSDVGGGHGETGLSDTTLKWMVRQARAKGLRFRFDWTEDLREDPDQAPHVTDYRLTSPRVPGVLVDDEFHEGNVVRYPYSDGRPAPAG